MLKLVQGFQRWIEFLGQILIAFVDTTWRLGSFTLITLGVFLSQGRVANQVVRPLIRTQVARAGVRLLPIVGSIGFALGFVIIGQTLRILSQVGQTPLLGSLFVTVVFRELAPLTAALVVLARVGTPTVVELGTARALGEVEALESLGIDPVHYQVIPRVVGITFAVFALAVYLILFCLGGGWLFTFAAGISIPGGSFLGEIIGALRWQDFPLLALKTLAFGASGALITCYQGLARPLRLEEVPEAATRTVAHSVIVFLILDALFLAIHLLLPA